MRTEKGRIQGTVKTECFDLARGHMLMWTDRANPGVYL